LGYEHERRIIFTNDPVQISGESVELSASSLKYDLNNNKIILTGNVEAAVSKDSTAIQNMGTRRQ
jgi:hypothetical protein